MQPRHLPLSSVRQGSTGEMYLGTTLVDAPKAASSSVSRYSSTTRVVSSGGRPSLLSIPRVWLAFAGIRLASTPKLSPPTKALINAAPQNCLEEMPEQTALPETPVPVLRKGRMVRHRVGQVEPAKPPIRQIDMHLFTEASLGSNALAIAQQQHPDHQLRVNRRTAM